MEYMSIVGVSVVHRVFIVKGKGGVDTNTSCVGKPLS